MFLDKPAVKNSILAITPIVIGIFPSIIFGFDDTNEYRTPIIIVSIVVGAVLLLLYLVLLCHYAKNDTNLKAINDKLGNENKALLKASLKTIAMNKKTAESLNSIANSIVNESCIDLNVWSFEKYSMWVCEAIFEMISELNNGESEFGVSYVKKLEDTQYPNHIVTIGYANSSSNPPHVFGKIRDLNEKHAYFDTKIFKSENPDIITLDNHDAIFNEFEYENKKDKSKKYSQYIGYPVMCNDNKMIGLIQIVSYGGTKIAQNNEELKQIAKKYITQFAFSLLLLSKTEKSLISVPSLDIKRRYK